MNQPLEQRYRRLLRLYPADYRVEHEEELVGVLLDCAEPGSDRPTVRATVDLLRGALRCRLIRAGRVYNGAAWRDAAALMALLLTGCALVGFGQFDGLAQVVFWESLEPGSVLSLGDWETVVFPLVAWVLALAALVAGGRRIRIAAAVLVAAAPVVAQLLVPYRAELRFLEFEFVNRFIAESLLIVVLLAVAAPRRQLWRLLGRLRAIALVAVSVGYLVVAAVWLDGSRELFSAGPVTDLVLKWSALVLMAALIFGFRTAGCHRAWLLLAAYFLLDATIDIARNVFEVDQSLVTDRLVELVLAPVLFLGVMWLGARRIRSRDSTRPPSTPA